MLVNNVGFPIWLSLLLLCGPQHLIWLCKLMWWKFSLQGHRICSHGFLFSGNIWSFTKVCGSNYKKEKGKPWKIVHCRGNEHENSGYKWKMIGFPGRMLWKAIVLWGSVVFKEESFLFLFFKSNILDCFKRRNWTCRNCGIIKSFWNLARLFLDCCNLLGFMRLDKIG